MLLKNFHILLIFLLISKTLISMDKNSPEKTGNKEEVTTGVLLSVSPAQNQDSKLNSQSSAQDQTAAQSDSQHKCQKILNGISPKTIFKSLTYRLFAISGTILSAYLFTKDPTVSFSIGGLNGAVATILYYTYDRIWQTKLVNNTWDKAANCCSGNNNNNNNDNQNNRQ